MKFVQSVQKTGVPFSIHTGHLNNLLLFPTLPEDFEQLSNSTISIIYTSEVEGNTRDIMKDIPFSFFVEGTSFNIELGSVYLTTNGSLDIVVKSYNIAPESNEEVEIPFKVFRESNTLSPFFFTTLSSSNDDSVFKNSLEVYALGSTLTNFSIETQDLSFLYEGFNYFQDPSFIPIFQSLSGIPQDVTVTVEDHSSFSQGFGSINPDKITPILISKSIYFPIGELGKEIQQNLLYSEAIMKNFETDNYLQSLALIKAGFGYSSSYYREILDSF